MDLDGPLSRELAAAGDARKARRRRRCADFGMNAFVLAVLDELERVILRLAGFDIRIDGDRPGAARYI